MPDVLDRLRASLADRYRLERELGAGGMATVYLAQDLRHERRVAIKVLHPELGAVLGGDRFLSEIKTTANLSHPNILGLFDSGIADGLLYYVMPFVDGETLRSRLTREKQIPIEDAVAITRGAAAALDYAHRHGVIHRDIKPENILLQDGQPLVADFGIALAVKAAGGVRLTQTGLSLGTPQYMSPEQATGERELDAKSDVYALGAVLYEMLTGEPPFSGSTTQAIIAKLMTEEPRPVSVLRKAVPPGIEEAVHRALEKLPADRFGSAAEFGAALSVGRTGTRMTSARIGTQARSGRRQGPVALAGMALLLVAGGFAGGRLLSRGGGDTRDAIPARLAIINDAGNTIASSALARTIDISQDGQLIAYAANGPVSDFVELRRLDGRTLAPISSSTGVRQLRISPDGRYLFSPRGTGSMQKVPIGGGGWVDVPGVENTPFLSWAEDGTLWWSPDLLRGIHRIRPGSEKDEHLFATGPGQRNGELAIQQVLPGDRFALTVGFSGANTGPAVLLDLKTGEQRALLETPIVEIRYADGVLIYARADNSLWGIPFDPATGRTHGDAVQLATDVSLTGAGVAEFAVSRNGTVVYLPTFGRSLVMVDRSGAARPVVDDLRNFHSPRISPDGRRIVLDNVTTEGRDVWVLERASKQLTRVTFDKDGHDPVWALDGLSVYYASGRSGTYGVWRIRPGVGGGKPDSVLADPRLGYTGTPLRDGTMLNDANDANARSGGDIVLVSPGQANPVTTLFATPFTEAWAVPSPDEKWLAFTSDQTGRQEVYVHQLGAEGTLTQVSLDGGSEPVWSHDGRELFYRRTIGSKVELVAAEIRLGGEATIGKRTSLFDVSDYEASQPHANYDVSSDGKSFVMLRRSSSSHIEVILNVGTMVRQGQSVGAVR